MSGCQCPPITALFSTPSPRFSRTSSFDSQLILPLRPHCSLPNPGRACQWEDLVPSVRAKVLQVISSCRPHIKVRCFEQGGAEWRRGHIAASDAWYSLRTVFKVRWWGVLGVVVGRQECVPRYRRSSPNAGGTSRWVGAGPGGGSRSHFPADGALLCGRESPAALAAAADYPTTFFLLSILGHTLRPRLPHFHAD